MEKVADGDRKRERGREKERESEPCLLCYLFRAFNS